ncbi:hypothetical protein [Sporosarcina sp. Te-1]|uniref:hypothetical protein n=1 Tax=Sporosarcina sp. Te-1 TaxID=2818390 RepID=UPI001A9CCD9A|nr:hypothetical protein [Sporosarcina sp. Te-1]QTD43063.1 hypothetical protein J3U78_10120 [Sporosarcina sp. Te-1]
MIESIIQSTPKVKIWGAFSWRGLTFSSYIVLMPSGRKLVLFGEQLNQFQKHSYLLHTVHLISELFLSAQAPLDPSILLALVPTLKPLVSTGIAPSHKTTYHP